MSDVPRPEHPRPRLVRPRWRNLNGTWELGVDANDRGLAEGWEQGHPFEGRVVVPYPVGSPLSGADAPGEVPALWYRRSFELSPDDLAPRAALRIGACDYETRVFVNGRSVAHHRGGYDPIAGEAAFALRAGTNEVVLRVEDPPTWTRPRGKQTAGAFRSPVDYDPVIGPWQTVWLEPLPEVSVDDVWTLFTQASGQLRVNLVYSHPWPGEVEVVLSQNGQEAARDRRSAVSRLESSLVLEVPAARLWSPDDPFLYDLRVRLLDGERVVDEVSSYAGLREIACEGGRMLLNGEPVYLRGVLDQGYFPGGWYTAATDDDLRRDVELTRELGLNCARKHQKAEDPRWLHWADRLGLLVWGEMPSGRDFTAELATDLSAQWAALVRRDRGSPSVITWVPFNESWGVWQQASRPEQRALVDGVVGLTRALDPSRPVVGNDGWEFSSGDLYTLHVYDGEGEDVATRLRQLIDDPSSEVLGADNPIGPRLGALPGADPGGLPVLLTECGGVGYVMPGEEKPDGLFAYGDLPVSPEELEARIRQIANTVHDCREIQGFVWTQLTDIQQEMNGLLGFDRTPKLPLATLRSIFSAIGRA